MEIYELDGYLRDNSDVHDYFIARQFVEFLQQQHDYPHQFLMSDSQRDKMFADNWETYLDKLILKIDYLMQKDGHYSTAEWVKFIESTDLVTQLENSLYVHGMIR